MLAPIKASLAKKSLLAKGFRGPKGKRDHSYFFLYVNGKKKAIFAKISHGARAKEIDSYILGKMRKTLKLESNQQAADLLTCKMIAEVYLDHLRKDGHI